MMSLPIQIRSAKTTASSVAFATHCERRTARNNTMTEIAARNQSALELLARPSSLHYGPRTFGPARCPCPFGVCVPPSDDMARPNCFSRSPRRMPFLRAHEPWVASEGVGWWGTLWAWRPNVATVPKAGRQEVWTDVSAARQRTRRLSVPVHGLCLPERFYIKKSPQFGILGAYFCHGEKPDPAKVKCSSLLGRRS